MRSLAFAVGLFATLTCVAREGPLVAVDVGHYLAEPGAMSARGRAEFEFNRELAVEIAAALEARGLRAKLIGADGDMAVLSRRTAVADGAALFVSVHHDSVQPRYLQTWEHDGQERRFSDRFAGYSLFVSRRNPLPQESLACASSIGAALQPQGFAPSLYHAEPIPGESKPFADRANGVHWFDNLVVLHSARQPAVLFEAGVIVNRAEEVTLRDPDSRRRIAAAVADGVRDCLRAQRGAL